jgi:hypothetical protein
LLLLSAWVRFWFHNVIFKAELWSLFHYHLIYNQQIGMRL